MTNGPPAPRFDALICAGRVCTARRSSALRAALEAEGLERVRVETGGCYGLCDFGPNLVVRRHGPGDAVPPLDVDRLTLTGADNEIVYAGVDPDEAVEIVRRHLSDDAPTPDALVQVRAPRTKRRQSVADRIARLRESRSKPSSS